MKLVARLVFITAAGWALCVRPAGLPGVTQAAAGGSAPPQSVATAELENRLPQLMKTAKIPGLSLVVIREGKIHWQRTFGVKNVTTNEPVDDRTVFEAASLSKPVFAYAVLKLADSGKLDLDAPLAKYLPGDYVGSDERVRRITARMVLSHTTGFPNWRPRGQPLAIHFTPGEKFSYSGEGYVYLQKVVERLSGQPLDEFMKQTVFGPLGMTDSSYTWQSRYDTQSATGHDWVGEAKPKNKPTEANAAASLHTTGTDYARFVAAILNGTGLKTATLGQMLSPQSRVDEGCVNCIKRNPSRLSAALSWGLGWGLERTEAGQAFWHWGDNGIFRCYVMAFPGQRAGVLLLTNSENGLSITQDVIARTVGGQHPALAWIDYDQYDSPTRSLINTVMHAGAEAAISQYRHKDPSLKGLKEGALNNFGYQLLRQKRIKDAIEVFKLNVEAFPQSFNVYDSLGEAYLTAGEKELAIKNYRKSVELNPANTGGLEALKKLEAEK